MSAETLRHRIPKDGLISNHPEDQAPMLDEQGKPCNPRELVLLARILPSYIS
jgi:hypothetical protein